MSNHLHLSYSSLSVLKYNNNMEHDLDLDIGLDPGITKDDFLCSTLSPSSSSTSLYQLQGSYAHHRREPTSSAYTTTTTTTIITTTTTTTTTAIATSTSSTASADSIMSEKPSLASTLMPVPSYQEDYHQLYNDNGELSIFPSLRLASEGPYLFLFDYSISLYFPIRMLILFVLGFAFSLVVDHLQTQHNLTTYPNNIHQLWATASWLPPICGVSAVLIGSIYPLGDYLWWGRRVVRDGRDWSSVMRCFGGLIGVNYAASKLAWTSSLQITCTLALISVGLWFWFDYTFHGFMISLTAASLGTMVAYILVLNGWYSFTRTDFFGIGSWIPCILYSSSVCFGSIGRQLDIVPATWYDGPNTIKTQLKIE